MMSEFPEIVEAWKRREQSQWDIGDRIIEAIGKPSRQGTHNGRLKGIKDAIEAAGCDCDIKTLYDYWVVAAAFPLSERSERGSWSVHRIAGDPKMLKRIIREAGDKPLTVSRARANKKKLTAPAPVATASATDKPDTAKATGTVSGIGVVTGGAAAAPAASATTDRAARVSVVSDTTDEETPFDQEISFVNELVNDVLEKWSTYQQGEFDAILRGIARLRQSLDRLQHIIEHGPRDIDAA